MLDNDKEKLSVEEKKIKEQVEEISTTTFSIQGVPVKVFERFLNLCKEKAQITKVFNDYKTGKKQIRKELCYSIALTILLDAYEADGKYQVLYEKMVKLEEKVDGSKKA